ncbi:MAG: hypothetical protein KGS44_12755 [Alphaproteobacteria bacterium]|nr:hypothetical protein [Alphaproteobacteria bacterium]
MADFDPAAETPLDTVPAAPPPAPAPPAAVAGVYAYPEPNSMAEAARLVADNQGARLRANLLASQGIPSATTAKALDIAGQLGAPVATVERNLADFEGIAKRKQYAAILDGSPLLKQWMLEPINTKVGQDDIEKLAKTESVWRGVADTLVRAPVGGAVNAVGSTIAGLGEAYDIAKWFTQKLFDMGGVPNTGVSLPWYADPGEILRRGGGAIKTIGEIIDVPKERQTFGDQVTGGVGQMAGQIAQMLLTGGGGGILSLFGQGVDQMVDQVKSTGKYDTIEGKTAILAGGGITALTEKMGLDLILNRVPPAIKNKVLRVGADILAAGGIEAAEEFLEQTAQNGVTNVMLRSQAEYRPVTEGAFDAAAPAFFSAGLVRGAVLGAGRFSQPKPKEKDDRTLNQRWAERQAQAVDALVASVSETNLSKMSPEKMADYLENLAKHTGDQSVFIPADVVQTYLQSKPLEDMQRFADALGISEQLPEALARGGDVVIPLAKYVSEVGKSDAHKAWLNDLRLEVDGLSVRQAEEDAKTQKERVKLAVERFEKQLEAGIAEVDATTRVYEDMRDKLKSLGQFTNDAAEQQAALFAERYAARAARNPNQYADAWDAYSKAGPGKGLEIQTVLSDRVRAMPPDDLDLLLNSIRSGKVKPTGTDADANAKFASDRTELKAALDSMGLDTGKLTNAQIRKAIKDAVEKRKSGTTLDQPAWHGSPHIFDRFDLSKIGTGEGAQAYGWGLYFAGNKAVAKYYREKLSAPNGADWEIIKKAIQDANGGQLIGTTNDTAVIYRAVTDKSLSDAEAAKRIFTQSATMRTLDKDAPVAGPHPVLEKMVRQIRAEEKPGRLYQVEIPDDGAYLHWDKPLSEQSPEVQKALAKLGIIDNPNALRDLKEKAYDAIAVLRGQKGAAPWVADALTEIESDVKKAVEPQGVYLAIKDAILGLGIDKDSKIFAGVADQIARDVADVKLAAESFHQKGGQIYLALAKRFEQEDSAWRELGRTPLETPGGIFQAASLALREAGIPGIQYLDGTSRGKGDGSHNYVLFDDSLAEIKSYEQSGVPLFGKGSLDIKGTGPHGKITVLDVGKALTADHLKKHKRQFFPEKDKKDYASVLKFATAEVGEQLKQAKSGKGWYGADVQLAIDLTAKAFPTLATNETDRRLYLTFAALFSNGLNPDQAWEISAEAFRYYLATGEVPVQRRNPDGSPVKMTTFKDNKTGKEVTRPAGWGIRNPSNEQQLGFLKFLVGREGGVEQAINWLLSPHAKTEINDAMTGSGLFKEGRYTTKVQREGEALGFMVFGEKLGRYAMGLHGVEIDANDTTVDLWYTRTFRRWTGRLLEGPLSKEGVAGEPATDSERQTIFRLTGDLSKAFKLTPGDTQAILWFFEKRLWGEQGIRTDEGTNSSGARKLLRGIGLDDGTAGMGAGQSPADAVAGAENTQGAAQSGEGKVGVDQSFGQEARGQISFTDNSTIISLFQSRDLSTLLHEAGGHLWLEELRFDATALGASDQIKADLKTTEDFLETRDDYVNRAIAAGLDTLKRAAEAPGASPRAKADYANVLALIDNTGGPVTQKQRAAFIEQMSAFWDTGDAPPAVAPVFTSLKNTIKHEKFAQAAETYFMEGKAPSAALASAFRSFKRWLTQIYRRLSAIGAPISPEMREVFDRLIATDEQIEGAQTKQGLNPIFKDAKSAGMTKAEFEAYTARANAVVEEAEQRLLQKTMDTIRKQRTKEWKADERNVREEVTQEVMSESGHQALALLTKGEFPVGTTPEVLKGAKLSKESIVETYGDESILPLLPAGIYRDRASGPGVMSADELAPVLGLGSGKELIERLTQLEAEKRALAAKGDNRSVAKARIDEETAQRMRERYGDPLNDGTIEQEAMAAVHSDKQAALMATELRVLARKAGHTGTVTLDDIQSWAEQTIADKKVRDGTRAEQYARAERDAGKKVERALMKGNFVEAFKAKQDQLVNLALYREAQKAAAEVESARKLMDRYATADTLKGMDQEYLEQIHQLLETYEFKRRSDTFLAERKSFEEWAIEQSAKGFEVVAPPRLDKGLFSTNYRDLTVEEILGLSDTVKQIAHLGRWKKEMLDGQKKREYEAIVNEAVAAVEAIPQRGVSLLRRGTTRLQDKLGGLGHMLRSADAALLKLETIFEWLDGSEKGQGVFSRVIFRRMSEAQARERDMQGKLNKQLSDIYDKVPVEQRKRWGEILVLPELGTKLNRSQLIAVALNIGNEGNLDKLLRGEKWDEKAVRAVLDKHLTKEEWQFVQDTWDLINGLWPEVEAMERRVNGVAPPKVEALSVETPFGTLKGGYYPAVYDPHASVEGEKIGAMKAEGLFDPEYRRATTRAGATRKRTGAAYPMLLSLQVIGQHLNEVSHDIAFREAVIDSYRFLSDKRIKEAVNNALGPEYAAQFEPWVKHIANEWAIDRKGVEGIEKFASVLRTNTTAVGMGFRITTMLSQVAGFANSIQRLGTIGMADGLRAFMKNPMEAVAFVHSRSGEMRNRMNDLERDIRQALLKIEGKTDFRSDVQRFAFRGIALFDHAVTIPTWIGAYNKGLKDGMADADASNYADKMVRDTQGAGSAKDLAAIQRGGEMLKLFTMFYSYFNVLYNRQRTLVRDAREVRSVGDAMEVLSQSFWLLIAPTLAASYLSGQGPDDDEDWGSWALRNVFFGMFSGLPWFRDAANTINNMAGGKGNFGGAKLSPVQGVWDTLIHTGKDVAKLIEGEETSDAGIKYAFNSVGLLTGLPTGQVGATSQFLWDALVSGSQSPESLKEWMSGLVYGPEKKK